jgi:type II secretory pathway pseudopilin PulG
MTLIEVIAGLVILGSILASLAIARGRFARQLSTADRKLAATHALDSMIAQWMDASAPPINRHGILAGPRGLEWQTREIRTRDAQQLHAVVVRVEVIDRLDNDRSAKPLLSVDLLSHVPAPTAASQPAGSEGTR